MELVVDEPARLVAIVTADAVEELGLQDGHGRDRGRQGDLGDGGARVRLALAILVAVGRRRHRARHRSTTTPGTVFAAASLTDAFPKIAPRARFSFAGSNTLAAQIRQGAPADVFASANTTLPEALYADGFCSKPVVFTRNTLVVIVPSSNPAGIHSVYDLRRKGIKLVIADKGVPVGSYTLQVLKNMNLTRRAQERRQPGDRRARGAGEGRARTRPTRASSTRPTRGRCRRR